MIERNYVRPAMEIVHVDVNIPYAFTKWNVGDGSGGSIGGGSVIEKPGSGGSDSGDGGDGDLGWGEND